MSDKQNAFRVWQDYFIDIGVSADVVDDHLNYISNLLLNKVPIVFEIQHLSLLLGLQIDSVYAMINSPKSFYRTFYIPKKLGGKREISTPLPSLLQAQRWINENILSNIEVSNQTHSFVRGRSIISNARAHLGHSSMLKVDITDFFGSIGIGRVLSIFKSVGYNETVATTLALLCTNFKKLPQGAATSPALSNLSCKRLDKRLQAAAAISGLTYTRYADDLTFSGDKLKPRFLRLVRTILDDEGFVANESKIRILGPRDKKMITGLIVDSDKIRPSASFRRKVWQDIHFAHKFGLMSHLSKRKIADPLYLDKLRGKLAFWRSIDPSDARLIEAERRLLRIQ